MQPVPQELLKEYVQSQYSHSLAAIPAELVERAAKENQATLCVQFSVIL